LLVVNLTSDTFETPAMRIGSVGVKQNFLTGGFNQDMTFGGDGMPDDLLTFDPHAVYVISIPDSAQQFSIKATRQSDDVEFAGSVETLNDGAVLYVRPPGLIVNLDQRVEPDDEVFGGRAWENIGTIVVTPDNTTPDSPAIEVIISEATGGIVAADAVRLRKVDTVMPELRLLTLNDNPLDNRAHDYYIPQLETRATELGLTAANEGPVNGELVNDMELRLTLTSNAGEQTIVSVSVTAIESLPNDTLGGLAAQIQSLLSTELGNAGLAMDAVELSETGGFVAIQINDSDIASLQVRGGEQLGFATGQGVGPDVEFVSNDAPQIEPIANQPGTPSALLFDGDNDVVFLNGNVLNGLTDVTTEYWINSTEFSESQSVISGSGNSNALNNEYLHFFRSITQFELWSHGGASTWIIDPIIDARGPVEGNWHHIAVVTDASTSQATLYIDGVSQGARFVNATPLSVVSVVLGQDQDSPFGGFDPAQAFTGTLDELRVWDTVRTGQQIRDNMNRALVAPLESDLHGYWTFDDQGLEGFNSVLDSTANANHGNPSGGVARVLGPVRINVTDTLGDPVFIEAFSDTSLVDLVVIGTNVLITPDAAFDGTALITVVAHDGLGVPGDYRGRSDQVTFDFTSGGNSASAIYGLKWNDIDGNGFRSKSEPVIDGVQVFVDLDGDHVLDNGEPTTYTDVNGEYAFLGLPFIEDTVAFGPAVLVGNSAVTPDAGTGQTTIVKTIFSTIETRTEATFDFFVATKQGTATKFLASIVLTPEQVLKNFTVQKDLVNDLNSLLLSNPRIGNSIAATFDTRTELLNFVTTQFGELEVRASTIKTVQETAILGDGSQQNVVHSTDTTGGALGFKELVVGVGVSIPGPLRILLVTAAATTPTNPDGDLSTSNVSVTVTAEIVSTSHMNLDLEVGTDIDTEGGSFTDILIGLIPSDVQGFTELSQLVALVNSRIASSQLAGLVTADVVGDRFRFTSTGIGEGTSLFAGGFVQTTREETTVFNDSNKTQFVISLPSQFGSGGLGFVEDGANGTERSYVIAEIPDAGWSPTVGVIPTPDGPLGVQTLLFEYPGNIAQNVNFGNILVAEIDLGEDRDVFEGDLVTLAPTVIDPLGRGGNPYTYLWKVQADNGQTIADGTGETFSFTPFDNGTYSIRLFITDTDRGLEAYPATVLVVSTNKPPVFGGAGASPLPAPELVAEGDLFELRLPYTDSGTNDSHLASIDWGDGSPVTNLGRIDTDSNGDGLVAADHVYADNGDYTVVVTLTDDEGAAATANVLVKVTNVDPVINQIDDVTINEGDTLGLISGQIGGNTNDGGGLQGAPGFKIVTFNDLGTLDTHTATIDWGDGTVDDASIVEFPFGPPGKTTGMAGTITGGHNYADDGIYTVTVTLLDDDAGQHSTSFDVTVENARPLFEETGKPDGPTEGELFELAPVDFNDGGTLDTHTATINWGDGSPVEDAVVTETPFGPPESSMGMSGTIAFPSHVYADNGIYTTVVTVTDDDGDSDTLSRKVTVDNEAPTITAAEPQTATEGLEAFVDLAFFNDLGTLDTHTATVDWGDGLPSTAGIVIETPFGPPGDVTGANGTVIGTHTYLNDGVYNVTVTLIDDDDIEGDTQVSTSLIITVGNVAPTVDLMADPTVFVGTPWTLSGTLMDVQADLGSLAATVNFSDGTAPQAITVNADGTFEIMYSYSLIGSFDVIVEATDGADSSVGSISVNVTQENPPAYVSLKKIFYNDSSFDGNDPAANVEDEQAIADNKQALVSGQTATFANYTSYTHGINGIILDLVNATDASAIDASDFEFHVGNDGPVSGWDLFDGVASVSVREGGGEAGSDRVTIIFPNGSIRNQWLQVTVKLAGHTGLITPDVFYFGNAVGETGNSSDDAIVDVSDMTAMRGAGTSSADIGNDYDFGRDGRVNVFDLISLLDNRSTSETALQLITPAAIVASAPIAALVADTTVALEIATSPLALQLDDEIPVLQPRAILASTIVSRSGLTMERRSIGDGHWVGRMMDKKSNDVLPDGLVDLGDLSEDLS